jgi:hypothetical protein
MTSEWLRVMLDEIARKKAEAEEERLEFARRRAEHEAAAKPQQERAGERPAGGPPA